MNRRNAQLITLLVLALSAPLGGCDATAKYTEQEHIQRAKDFEDKGNLKGSIIELKNAILKNPDSPQAQPVPAVIRHRHDQPAHLLGFGPVCRC